MLPAFVREYALITLTDAPDVLGVLLAGLLPAAPAPASRRRRAEINTKCLVNSLDNYDVLRI